jgi:hypothetical protein
LPRSLTLPGRGAGHPIKTLRADRPDVAARRRIWQAARPFVDADKLVFIDETGASTKMIRL